MTNEIVSSIKEILPAGIVLFNRNITSPNQCKYLIKELRSILGYYLLFAVDHEGFPVNRFSFYSSFPSNRALGASNNIQLAYSTGVYHGYELKKLGVDINFSPVLDVVGTVFNPAITLRSISHDPSVVNRFSQALIKGMNQNGVCATIKHFPGIGFAPVDGHLTLPVVEINKHIFMSQCNLFKSAIKDGIKLIMTSHIILTDHNEVKSDIVTFSKKFILKKLRKDLGYKGIILTDDLEMGALKYFGTIEECALKAIQAGHDAVLSCKDIHASKKTHEVLLHSLQTGELDQNTFLESTGRIDALQNSCKQRASLSPSIITNKQVLIRKIVNGSVSVTKDPNKILPTKDPLIVFYPKLSSFYPHYLTIPDRFSFKKIFASMRKRYPVTSLSSCVYTKKTTHKKIVHFLKTVSAESTILFFSYNAVSFPIQKQVIHLLKNNHLRTVFILMGDPIDVTLLPESSTVITTYGALSSQIKRAIELVLTNKKHL
ncbi:glycoside hydrolase family 3 N-terminal domain-containing protein [Chlamydiota bacterium]